MIPELDRRSNSWIITDRRTGAAVLETRQRSVAEKVNQKRYRVQTALVYLVGLTN